MPNTDVTARASLATDGFVRFEGAPDAPDFDLDASLAALRDEFARLPADPYGAGANRYRRYSRGVLLPWTRQFTWLPNREDEEGNRVVEYFQAHFNPEFANERRGFPALSERARRDPLLMRLIWHDYDHTSWDEAERDLPVHVGVHFVKMMVEEDGQFAESSPAHLHQDGEPYTFVHLVLRENAIGAVNSIAAPRCAGLQPEEVSRALIVTQFELTQLLESYGVKDDKVSHHVSALARGPQPGPAQRGVILVDFTPMVPRI